MERPAREPQGSMWKLLCTKTSVGAVFSRTHLPTAMASRSNMGSKWRPSCMTIIQPLSVARSRSAGAARAPMSATPRSAAGARLGRVSASRSRAALASRAAAGAGGPRLPGAPAPPAGGAPAAACARTQRTTSASGAPVSCAMRAAPGPAESSHSKGAASSAPLSAEATKMKM